MKKILLLTAIISLHLSSFSQTWMQKDSLPISGGLLAPFSFSIGGMLYVGGGYNGGYLDSFYQYNPGTNIWTAKANVPSPIEAGYGFVLNGMGYLVCGYTGSNLSNAVYMYDPTNNSWTQKNNFPGTARQNHICFSANGKGYLFAGFLGGGVNTNEMWQYNDSTDSWVQKASAPGPGRNNPSFLVINNQIYVGMGGTTNTSQVYSDFYLFDPVANTYTAKDSIPEARACSANFTLNNIGYIGLGYSTGAQYLSDFYTYDATANTWTKIDSFGGGGRAHVFNEVVNGVPYVGSGDYSSGQYKSDNWSYGFPAGIQNVANSSAALLCYPSPTSGAFTIDMTGYGMGDRQISICDQLGRTVYQTISSENKVQVNDKLSSGLYTVSVTQDARREYTRVVVE